MRDGPLKKCPKCGKLALKRLIGGGAGLIFKGSGFYITDYRKPDKNRPDGDSKAASVPKAAGDPKVTPVCLPGPGEVHSRLNRIPQEMTSAHER